MGCLTWWSLQYSTVTCMDVSSDFGLTMQLVLQVIVFFTANKSMDLSDNKRIRDRIVFSLAHLHMKCDNSSHRL